MINRRSFLLGVVASGVSIAIPVPSAAQNLTDIVFTSEFVMHKACWLNTAYYAIPDTSKVLYFSEYSEIKRDAASEEFVSSAHESLLESLNNGC